MRDLGGPRAFQQSRPSHSLHGRAAWSDGLYCFSVMAEVLLFITAVWFGFGLVVGLCLLGHCAWEALRSHRIRLSGDRVEPDKRGY